MGTITIFARMGVKGENVEKLTALAAHACKVAADEPGTLLTTGTTQRSTEASSCSRPARTHPLTFPVCRRTVTVNSWAASWELIDSLEFVVLGEPTPEHAAALSSVPGAQFFSEVASI